MTPRPSILRDRVLPLRAATTRCFMAATAGWYGRAEAFCRHEEEVTLGHTLSRDDGFLLPAVRRTIQEERSP